MLSEVSQTEKDKYCMVSVICGIQKKKIFFKLVNITEKKQTHRYREQITGYQWGEGRERGNIGEGD